jgi:ATP-dependent RNA helicase DeaD
MTNVTFDALPLSDFTLKAVEAMGFQTASPIQAEAIPHVMQGIDVIGQAQTGTGKTAAFGIPIIEKVEPFKKTPQALILCPTRELALQVAEEIKKLATFRKGIFVTAVYGGDSIERQIKALRSGANVIVGTPGRMIDHIERRTLKLDEIQTVVLDEADEMLDMGFREDIESILQETPEERQTILFSATMPPEILALTKKYQRDPKLVKVTRNEVTNQNIEQFYFDVRSRAKMEVMCRLIDFNRLKLSLVFCNQKRVVDEIVEELQLRGYQAEGLHGDMRQAARNNVMSKFRSGHVNILVATDVAARGIDVDDVDAVINYDVPLDPEQYVHRIGRTGRAGKQGKAFSLVEGSERYRLRDIQRYTKKDITKGIIPSFADVIETKKVMFLERVSKSLEEGQLEYFADMLPKLEANGHTAADVVATLVKMQMGTLKNDFGDQDLDGENERMNRRQGRPEGRDGSRGGRFEGRERRGDGRGDGRFERRGEGRFERDGNRGGGRFERRGEGRHSSPVGARREAGPRFDRQGNEYKRGNDANMVRLQINIGRSEKISPSNIVGAIAGESGIAGNQLGAIDIFDRHSFVDVPKGIVSTVLNRMVGATIKGRRVVIEVATAE